MPIFGIIVHMDRANTHANNYAHEARATLLTLAQLLGKQAAREAAAADNNSSTDKEGASDD
jgi:hypothetical protein